MRRLIRATMATLASLALALPTAVPAGATPGPNDEEWWFDSLAIQAKAWPYTTGEGVTVAVLDTGVNASLPEFRGGVVLPGTAFDGDSGDGRRDFDTASGHGTGMASLIAGQGGGQSGIVGVAPSAKILPIDVHIGGDNAAKAIRYAADHGAKVINISQGIPSAGQAQICPPDVQDAVAYAVKHDAVILVAAGNSGDITNMPEYPAGCAGVLAVGAVDHNGSPWVSTARQPYVTVAGPGAQVSSLGKDGRLYHYGNGTSQATAITSGEVALIRAKFRDEPAKQIVQRIIATTTDVGSPGKDDQTGYGVVSLRKAMTATVASNAPNPVYDRLDKALAAQGKDSGSDESPPPQSSKKNSSGSSPLVLVLGGGLVLAILVIVFFVVGRNRRGGPPSPGQGFGPPDHSRQPGEGPPPSFGPPQHPNPYDQGPAGGSGAAPYQDPPSGQYR